MNESKKSYEQRIVEYLVDDNNYLPGHAEVVVSIEDHIWDMVVAVYEKYQAPDIPCPEPNETTVKAIEEAKKMIDTPCPECFPPDWGECPFCGRTEPDPTYGGEE